MVNLSDNTVGKLLEYTLGELAPVSDETESLNIACILFEHYFGWSRADLVIRAEERVSESEILHVHKTLLKLKEGQPVEYVVGNAVFGDLTLKVNEHVLIPRPETEELVAWMVSEEADQKHFLDIGTGSGCIALGLAHGLKGAQITACDVSQEALTLARENGAALGLDVNWLGHDILNHKVSNLPQPLQVIVSNPPYVLEKEKEEMQSRVTDWEPHVALFVPDEDPLLFYRHIIAAGKELLAKNGSMYFEIHEAFGRDIFDIFEQHGYGEIRLKQDLQGKDRMIKAKWQ